jgi:hypothetical protein
MNYRISAIDGKTLIIEIEKNDTGPVVDMLAGRGCGYAVFGEGVDTPFAVIDSRLLDQPGYTQDHMLAIEAHELGHIHMMSDDEQTAELAGIKLLEKLEKEGAAELLRTRGVV